VTLSELKVLVDEAVDLGHGNLEVTSFSESGRFTDQHDVAWVREVNGVTWWVIE